MTGEERKNEKPSKSDRLAAASRPSGSGTVIAGKCLGGPADAAGRTEGESRQSRDNYNRRSRIYRLASDFSEDQRCCKGEPASARYMDRKVCEGPDDSTLLRLTERGDQRKACAHDDREGLHQCLRSERRLERLAQGRLSDRAEVVVLFL